MDVVNRRLGGHAATLAGIRALVTDQTKTYHIVDLGCGSGDSMRCIAEWARKNRYKVSLTGVDINADCIDYVESACIDYPEIEAVVTDCRDYLKSNNNIDIVLCSLVCHHLTDGEIVQLLRGITQNARVGFVINDLHRHRIAYYGIQLLSRLLKRSYLFKNDGPLSVLRGFHRCELIQFLDGANIKNYQIRWKWAFRYLVVGAFG